MIGEFSFAGNRKREDMGMCKFCEMYESTKELEEESGIKHNYYAVLQERSVVNGKEKGILNNRPVKLVYCPSCGRKLQ